MPKKRMVLKNKTLAEIANVKCSYPIKVRIKIFEVRHKDGSIHKRGPCLSFQQFNPDGHFLSAVSIDIKEFDKFFNALADINKYWVKNKNRERDILLLGALQR